ncbi:MAG: hypothetical protein AMXMBFR33_17730 [Candidatus Xenobia bacterium]
MSWTTQAEVRKRVRRLWDQGRLLAEGEQLFPLRIPLKGPTSDELASRFAAVQDWIAGLRSPAYRLEMRSVRHRVIGRNEVPVRVWLDTPEAALALIGKTRDWARFRCLTEETRARCPEALPWLLRRPLRALELADSWASLLDVTSWLKVNPRPGVFVRQVDFPGVHTKFIEQHKTVLRELLELALPAEAVDAEAGNFEGRFGFLQKPTRVRFRLLDSVQELPPELTDLSLARDEFARFAPSVSRIFIAENEINVLAFPRLPDSLVVFGSGYLVETMDRATWLKDRPIYYWGDIDTHGFAILHRLREHFPQTRSLMMDRATLLEHRSSWVTEKKATAEDVFRLTPEERELYLDLVRHRYAPSLRLEQEFIRFPWVHRELAGAP